MRIVISFFAMAVGTLSLVYGYVGWRMIAPLPIRRRWKALLWVAILLAIAAIPASFMARRSEVPGDGRDLIAWVGFLSMGMASLAFPIVLVRDLGWVLARAVRRIGIIARTLLTGARPFDAWDRHRRRAFVNLTNGVAAALIVLLTGYGVWQARRTPPVEEVEIAIAGLPADLAGFRIAQITDIHVGPTIKRPFVEKVVARVNELRPDIVALTGDLVDGSVPNLREDVAPIANLRAPYGRFFVTGNHEYYSGAEPWIAEVRRLGFDVLMNENRIVTRGAGRIVLGGVPDIGHDDSDPVASMAGAPAGDVSILLAHQPKSIFAAAEAGYDLMICGHTHDGQYVPWTFLIGLFHPYAEGLHTHGRTFVYVSRGTGYWGPPLRVGVPPEITLFRLVPAPKTTPDT